MTGRILIGTSSWTDPTLVKDGTSTRPTRRPPRPGCASTRRSSRWWRWTPPTTSRRARRTRVLWIERTPPEFTFNIKAYSLLTNHPTRARVALQGPPGAGAEADKRNVYRDQLPDEAVDEVWQRFRDALMPLHSAGKLGAVLFQFPQWFVISRKSKAYIEECTERLPDFRVAVEFRHSAGWRSATSRRRCRSWRSATCPTSASTCRRGSSPRCRRSPRPRRRTWRWCASTVGTTRHGRSRARPRPSASGTTTRRRSSPSGRPQSRRSPRETRETHVLMNNCYQDFAVRSARELGDLLDLDFG